jgi:hypothetical protein
MSLEHYLPDPSKTNVCELFKSGARDTWARIFFSRKTPRLKIHETSVSQNLVYEMNLIKGTSPFLDFDIFESTDEKANGDDLELTVKHADGKYYTYAIQSKIIYHRRSKGIANLREGYYKQLKHWVGKGARRKKQVDLLIAYSKKHGFMPLYLLYNYVEKSFDYGIEAALYGCTVVSAQYLKDNYTSADGNLDDKVKFSDLHTKNAFPWHELVCVLPYLSRADWEKRMLFEEQNSMIVEPSRTLQVSEIWKPLDTSFPVIIADEERRVQYDTKGFDDDSQGPSKDKRPRLFLPKYKFVINTISQ